MKEIGGYFGLHYSRVIWIERGTGQDLTPVPVPDPGDLISLGVISK